MKSCHLAITKQRQPTRFLPIVFVPSLLLTHTPLPSVEIGCSVLTIDCFKLIFIFSIVKDEIRTQSPHPEEKPAAIVPYKVKR